MQPAIAADGIIHVEFYQQGSRLGACHYGVNPNLRAIKPKTNYSRLSAILETFGRSCPHPLPAIKFHSGTSQVLRLVPQAA
jgi:hypothetical protein